MKNKKLWARIGAFLACVLFVGVLAVPCFAYDSVDDTVIWPPPAEFKTSFYQNYLKEEMYNSAYIYLEWAIPDQLFIRPAVISGTINTAPNDFTRLVSVGDTNDIESYYIVDYSFYSHGGAYNNVGEGFLFRKFLLDSYVITLTDTDYYPLYTFNYTFTFDNSGFMVSELTAIYDEVNGLYLDLSQTYYFAVAFRYESEAAAEISDIMFGSLGGTVYPKAYYEGFSDNYDNTYQEGFNTAVDAIGSGDFGRNLLGSGFSAPFQALKEFTLIEWTTENGTTFTVSMALLFSAIVGVSLFIWFLKIFAGG